MSRHKQQREQTTIGDAISTAFTELELLAEEMREWADNMEEKLSHTERYEQVSEAADTLENLSEPDADGLEQFLSPAISVLQYVQTIRTPRWARRDNCTVYLDAAISALETARDDLPETEANEETRDTLTDFIDELESARDDAEGVVFPGMFG